MKNWEDIRKKVDAAAEVVRKKSDAGMLISQNEAALIRESAIYAEMDHVEKIKKKEEVQKEKLIKIINDSDDHFVDDVHKKERVNDVSQVAQGSIRKEIVSDAVQDVKKKDLKETVQQENRRREFQNKYGIDVDYVKYENGFPVDSFYIKKFVSGAYPEDDRILVDKNGENLLWTKYEFDHFWVGLGYERDDRANQDDKNSINGEGQEKGSSKNIVNEEGLNEHGVFDDKNQENQSEVKELCWKDYVKLLGNIDGRDQKNIDRGVNEVFEKMEAANFDFVHLASDAIDLENQEQKKVFDQWVIENASNEYVAKRYLSYNDVLHKNIDDIVLPESAQKYAQSLKDLVKDDKFFDIVQNIKKQFLELIDNFGVSPSRFGISDSWVFWDIAKQKYFFDNQDVADKRYDIADPLESKKMQQKIIDRHLGWEIYAVLGEKKVDQDLSQYIENTFSRYKEIIDLLNKKPKNNGTLSSLDLETLGSYLRSGLKKEI